MAFSTPPHVVRSLSPISELTTPASARSIALPPVEKTYGYDDYKDESPIQPLTPHGPPRVNSHSDPHDEHSEDDRESTHSSGSTRRVVPSSHEPSPLAPVSPSSPLPSPPSTIRPFPSPTASLPPPPRPISTRGQAESQSSTPQSATVPLDHPLLLDHIPVPLDGDDNHTTAQVEGAGEDEGYTDHDEADRMSVSTAGIAGIGSGAFAETAKKKKGRPKSLHGTRDVSRSISAQLTSADPAQPPLSPISSSAAFPSHHASLVNIPNIPSIPPTPDGNIINGRPASRQTKSPNGSPQRSRPSSPRSRPSTLKKRPNSLHATRPTSWHSQKTVKAPKTGGKKGDKGKNKVRSRTDDVDVSASSNEDHSDTIKSPPLPTRNLSPRKRIPSILLSLFDGGSARQSRATSLVSSPTGCDIPHSPASPPTPSLNTLEDPEWAAVQPAPQEAIRTSGTFGIRDDGSVHLLRNDDEHPVARMSTSSEPSQLGRHRRDSDNGTVKSGMLDRRILYVNNRDSIDETDENDARRRSLTPFELDNPLSPLESVLSARGSEETSHAPERKSVDAPRNLLLSPGRSDLSQRAQSPSIEQSSISTARRGMSTVSPATSRETMMVDEATQTSLPSSPRRPLPHPPLRGGGLPNGSSASSHHTKSNIRGSDRVRPSSLPPPPLTSAYPQPRPEQPTSTTPELPLLIASHLLSNHAAALMRQSAGLVEGAEMMKRMADESMQWGTMLLNMASSTAGPQPPIPCFPTVPLPQVPPVPPTVNEGKGYLHVDGLPTPASSLLFDQLYPSRPVLNPSRPTPDASSAAYRDHRSTFTPPQVPPPRAQEIRQPYSSGESDRYTRLPARTRLSQVGSRMSDHERAEQERASQRVLLAEVDRQRSSLVYLQPNSAKRLSSEVYREVDDIGRKGFEELYKAEEDWTKGMNDLRSFLDAGPESASSDRVQSLPSASRDGPDEEPEEMLRRKSRVSTASGKKSSLRRPTSTSSVGKTDESFLPHSADLTASTSGTKTDESFLPKSADLVTPIDDATLRPTRPRINTRPSLSPPPPPLPLPLGSSIDSAKGYEPSQFHTLLGDQFKPFDIPPLPYGGKEYSSPPSALSAGSGGARKLRKRASAQSELRQSSGGGDGSVGGTMKSSRTRKKKHWWSRRSRMAESENFNEPVTAI